AEAFFGTPRGQEILKLEVEARRAMLDIAVEEAAQVEAERMKTERDPRLRLLRELIEAGDLIEMNVAGAMSANLAFFEGMAATGVPGMPSDRESMMAEVWGQEEGIRAETANWLVLFLALAYQPLPEADLKDYVAFSASAEGRRLNAALFAGFDAVSRKVSFELGRAAAEAMTGNDIWASRRRGIARRRREPSSRLCAQVRNRLGIASGGDVRGQSKGKKSSSPNSPAPNILWGSGGRSAPGPAAAARNTGGAGRLTWPAGRIISPHPARGANPGQVSF